MGTKPSGFCRRIFVLLLFLFMLPGFAAADETGTLTFSLMTPYQDDDSTFAFEVRVGSLQVNGTYGDLTFREGKAAFTLSEGEAVCATDLPAGLTFNLKSLTNGPYLEKYYNTDGYAVANPRGRIFSGETSGLVIAELGMRDSQDLLVQLDLGEVLAQADGMKLQGVSGSNAEGGSLSLYGSGDHVLTEPLRIRAGAFDEYGDGGERTYEYILKEPYGAGSPNLRVKVEARLWMGESLRPDDDYYTTTIALYEGTKRICKERWEGTKRCDVVFESKGSIYAARALTGTGLQVKGELMLLGREQKQGEFLFDILENGAVVGTARNEKDGSLTFSQIRYLPEDEGAHVYTVRQRSGEKADITYDEREYALGVMVKKEDGGMTASVTGLTRDGKPASSLRFENKYALTDFTVYNLWQGGNEGQIELWLYANGEKLKKQPEYAVDGAKYIYANLPMFAEDGSRIVYSAREIYVDDYMAMYVNTGEYAARTKMLYNGGTVINRRVLDFAFRMMYAGMNGRPEPKVQFTLYCNGKPYYMATQPEKDAYGRYTYRHLPAKVDGELAEYTVRVDSLPGYLVSYENRGTYAGLTDGAYEDGSVLARHVPLTGEPRHPWAQTGLITGVLGAAAAIALLSKRKQMD